MARTRPQPGKKDRASKSQAKNVLTERQRVISELILDCTPQYEVAEKLKLHPSVISKEMKKVRAVWRAETVATYDQHVRREMTRLDRDERAIREKLKEPALEDKDWIALHALLLKVSDRRAKLLGLDAPVKAEVKVASVNVVRQEVAGDPETERMARELAARLYAPKLEPKAITVDGTVVQRDVKPPNATNGNGHTNGASHA